MLKHTSTVALVVLAATTALLATGCAPAATLPGANSASNPASSQPPASHAAPPVEKLSGVPAKCLSLDEVSIAVKLRFNGVYPTTENGALVCEFYVDSNSGSPVIEMNYEPYGEGSAAKWQAAGLAARAGAKSVSGSGDAAIYFEDAKYHEFDFISGSTVCNITASTNFTEKQLAELAYFALTQDS